MSTISLDYLVRRSLFRHRDRVALAAGAREVTYGSLDERSDRLANALLGLGLCPGDRVATLLNNRIEFIEIEIATLKAAMVKAPINPRLAVPEIVAILADIEATALFVEPEFEAAIMDQRDRLPHLRLVASPAPRSRGVQSIDALAAAGAAMRLAPSSGAADLALMRFSGGTTGRPKGIMHSGGSLVSIALSAIREYELRAEDRFLSVAHLSHGQNFLWPALFAAGARMVLMDRFDPEQVLRHIEQASITRLHMVPTMWSAVVDHPRFERHDVSTLRNIVYASAPMAVERVRQMLRIFGPRLTQVYTLSESAVITTMLRPEDHVVDGPDHVVRRLASCGREALDVTLRIVDEAGREVPRGEVGEIAVSSPGNMMGYWRLPEQTAETLRDDWVLSGDLGSMDEDGYVFLVDRKDDKIVTGALNVYPREVEEILYEHPAVRECAVVGVPDDQRGQIVKAFVVLRPDYAGDEAMARTLQDFVKQTIAPYKYPRAVEFVDALPRTPTGKLQRFRLKLQPAPAA